MGNLSMGQWFICAGLMLDILGVCMLFRFGLPSKAPTGYLSWRADSAEIAKGLARYKRWAHTGLALLLAGFLLQLVGTVIGPNSHTLITKKETNMTERNTFFVSYHPKERAHVITWHANHAVLENGVLHFALGDERHGPIDVENVKRLEIIAAPKKTVKMERPQ